MSVGLSKKISILLKAIKIIKNWHVFVNLYFHGIRTEYTILELRNGFRVKLRSDSTDLMAFINVWLMEEYQRPGFEIKNDDIVIDIGAHIGLFALYSAQFCKIGKIFCYESIRENFDLLLSNVLLNQITNIFPINAAVSADNTTVSIYLSEDQAGHSMHIMGAKKVEVMATSLKEIFDSNKIEKCDFLKIDCEGAEYSIMNALHAQYYDKIEKICMEYHLLDNKHDLLTGLIERLHTSLFKVTKIETTANMGLLYAVR